jgi:hypothetical protein
VRIRAGTVRHQRRHEAAGLERERDCLVLTAIEQEADEHARHELVLGGSQIVAAREQPGNLAHARGICGCAASRPQRRSSDFDAGTGDRLTALELDLHGDRAEPAQRKLDRSGDAAARHALEAGRRCLDREWPGPEPLELGVTIGARERSERQRVGRRDQDGGAVEGGVGFVRYLDLERRGTRKLDRDFARAALDDQLRGCAGVRGCFGQEPDAAARRTLEPGPAKLVGNRLTGVEVAPLLLPEQPQLRVVERPLVAAQHQHLQHAVALGLGDLDGRCLGRQGRGSHARARIGRNTEQ